jgi:ATP-dependent Clp protease ATP-binding subunit ClpA
MELKPTNKVAEVLATAQRNAQAAGHAEITPDGITSALIQIDTPQAETLLQAAGTGASHVLSQADARLRQLPKTSGSNQAPTFGREALRVLQHADTLMRAKGDSFLARPATWPPSRSVAPRTWRPRSTSCAVVARSTVRPRPRAASRWRSTAPT